MLGSTNAIESLNARYRRAVSVREALPHRADRDEVSLPGHQVAGPQGPGHMRWTMRWKPAHNALAVTSADRMPPAEDR